MDVIKKFLHSRKFWAALFTAAVVFAREFGLDLDAETVEWIVNIFTFYVIGQGISDSGLAAAVTGKVAKK